ncbi:sensor histidine kinase [Promicromonospora sukumoe]|uniref:sensor histidine kinase n=1 Tax=Promicromonospora sukumoe TaxID=88382 RepID=UPI00036ACB5C|nr:HAMP domain-containing sensor histidine kinase [Promicromonospora sukumoe]
MSVPGDTPGASTGDNPADADLGVVGHELRSPLTAVIGYAQLLGISSLDDEQRRHVEVIERNGRRMLRLVDELLVSARLAAGTFGLDRADTDLAALAGTCVTDLAPTARAAGVTLTVHAPGPVQVPGDPDVLALAIDSLLGAAIKRTPRGGAVTVGVHAAGPDAVVEVSDTGVTLPPEALGRRTPRAVPGITLGLPVVTAVVTAHGGTVTVDGAPDHAPDGGAPGAGTRVSLTLPTRWSPPTASSGEASSTPRSGRSSAPGSSG